MPSVSSGLGIVFSLDEAHLVEVTGTELTEAGQRGRMIGEDRQTAGRIPQGMNSSFLNPIVQPIDRTPKRLRHLRDGEPARNPTRLGLAWCGVT